MGSEARERAVPQGDEAWFMLALLGITSFHGFTMMPFWGEWLTAIGSVLGKSNGFVASFTLSMLIALALPVVIYALAVAVALAAERNGATYRQLFAGFAFTALPLAFAYHLAHNMSHLVREGTNWAAAFTNPLGIGLAPLTMMEKHERMLNQVVPDEVLFTIQSGLLVLGFWLAVRIASNRAHELLGKETGASFIQRLPMLGFIVAITVMNIWLIAQDMEMRF